MGSGLSMTSVNKIKELATAREYSLALEIIDSQDLTKSLNPQFIRLCGDVYIANGRYADARKVLLMAHRMAPEAKRVIYSLVELYLKMGYKELADFYYRLYMFDAEANMPQTNHLKYIYDKAQGCPLQEIETLLFPMYSDVMDYDWSYELYLLMRIQGKKEYATAIKDDYLATYKSEDNSMLIEELEQSDERLEELFYSFSRETVQDDDPEQEELRQEEKILLEADELRMNPKEAEIQILFDDNDKVTLGAKLKYKKHLKEQEKLAKKAEKEGGLEDAEESQAVDENTTSDDQSATKVTDVSEESASDNKVNIFKKIFSKKKTEDAVVEEPATEEPATEESTTEEITVEEANIKESVIEESEIEESVTEESVIEESETEESEIEESEIEESEIEESVTEESKIEESKIEESKIEEPEIGNYDFDFDLGYSEDESQESDDTHSLVEDDVAETDDEVDEASVDYINNDIEEASVDYINDDIEEAVGEHIDDMGDSVMREIYEKKKISIVTELGEDTFVNTQDLEFESESENPFSKLINQSKKEVEEERKTSFVYEEVQLEPESEEELEVDDFSQPISLAGFDEQIQEVISDDSQLTHVIDTAEDNLWVSTSEEKSEITESQEHNLEVSEETTLEETTLEETAIEDVAIEDATIEDATIEDATIEDATIEDAIIEDATIEDAFEDTIVEEKTIEVATFEDAAFEDSTTEEVIFEEPTIEDAISENSVSSEEMLEDIATESTDVETPIIKDLINESVYDTLKEKNTLDFPEFKSTLFPEIGQEVAEVNNNFSQIMNEAQDKINENLLKEEQMQREAEALLASLGIDLGSVSSTVSTATYTNNSGTSVKVETATNVVVDAQDNVQNSADEGAKNGIAYDTVYNDVTDSNVEESAHKYSPSRDELKSSLKIDSVKKNILKQIKEYR